MTHVAQLSFMFVPVGNGHSLVENAVLYRHIYICVYLEKEIANFEKMILHFAICFKPKREGKVNH